MNGLVAVPPWLAIGGPASTGYAGARAMIASTPVGNAMNDSDPKSPPARSGTTSEDAVTDLDATASLAQIYEKYSPAIFAHCRRLLGSAAPARDATQEAFVRVMTKGPKNLFGPDALRYVYRVATNVCLNQIREQKVHDRAAPAMMARASSLPTGERQHADRQFAEALLDKCDDTGSSIALMHYVDEMSQVEIAKTLGITRRTVFNRLKKIEALARELVGLSNSTTNDENLNDDERRTTT